MKRIFAILALALLVTGASADYIAQFSPESSSLLISNDRLASEGQYGNYTATIGYAGGNAYVSVSGTDESLAALELEVGRAISEKLLSTACKPAQIAGMNESAVYCNPNGEWVGCAQTGECKIIPPAPMGASATSPNEGAGALPEAGTGAAAIGSALPTDDRSAKALPLPPGQRMGATQGEPAATINPEQMVQLLGAFLAIIVASYLLLQHKPPEISAVDKRLLENETRSGILQELSDADRIPTDLSNKLGKSKATVVEHLSALSSAGFVERIETPGKKYVFYRLTRKGKIALLKRAG